VKTWTNERPADWPSGPWDDEPDKAVWVDEATGLDCMIHRNRIGALCGYVGVGPDHPLHGQDRDDMDVEVHGGLTYSARCQEDAPENDGLCHVPEPGRPDDVWWFGFDCLHLLDTAPGLIVTNARIAALHPELGREPLSYTYKTFDYVKHEVEYLARQLAVGHFT
jgi:hypothetical protein